MSHYMASVLRGEALPDNARACCLLLAANIIAEATRFPASFFSPFAMLSVMQQSTTTGYVEHEPSWKRFVSLPERAALEDMRHLGW